MGVCCQFIIKEIQKFFYLCEFNLFFFFLFRFEETNTPSCSKFVECKSRSSGNCRSLVLTFNVAPIPSNAVIDSVFVQLRHSGGGTSVQSITALTNTEARAITLVSGGTIQMFSSSAVPASMLFDPTFRLSLGGASLSTTGSEVEVQIDCIFMKVAYTRPVGAGTTVAATTTTTATTTTNTTPTTTRSTSGTTTTTTQPRATTTTRDIDTDKTDGDTTISTDANTDRETDLESTGLSVDANRGPEQVDEGFPTWAIIVIVVVGVICIIGILYYVWAIWTRRQRHSESRTEKHTAPVAMATIPAASSKSEYGSITPSALSDHYKGVSANSPTSPYAELDVNEV
jgi:hypothetical protein